MLNDTQILNFVRHGYLVLPKLIDTQSLHALNALTRTHLSERIEPFELEADVNYPGAPTSVNDTGGTTIRRLQQAYHRDELYKSFAKHSNIVAAIQQLLKTQEVFINPNHHNCVMTKQPAYSSQTNWHRDTRYWQFSDKYLINAWHALGDEKANNGGMLILPGSHRWDIEEDCLDEKQFLIEDHPKNQTRLSMAEQVDLNAGDCLLFSAHCFHAAGANLTTENKYSLVFTYHGDTTKPLANTRSSEKSSIYIA